MKLPFRLPWPNRPELRVLAVVSLLVLLIQVLAVWAIAAGRERARQELRQELELQTLANARSLEALLATLRGDCLSVVHSPLTARFTATRAASDADADPVARRWSRLDVEAMLLLFLQANTAVERVQLSTDGDEREPASADGTILAGRRNGVPELLPPDAATSLGEDELVVGTWLLAEDTGTLRVWLRPRRLLEVAAPGFEDLLTIETGIVEASPSVSDLSASDLSASDLSARTLSTRDTPDDGVARQPVSDSHWQPPLNWTLVRRSGSGGLRASMEELTGRLGAQAGLSLALMLLVLLLGTVAIRQVRRAARFEAEAAQQARVRRLERQLEHSHRLASVGRLAAGIAHEINNPLAGMTNHLALLDDDLQRGDTSGASQQATRVREGLHRIRGIVRRVLTAATPDTSSDSWSPDELPATQLPATQSTAASRDAGRSGFSRLDLRQVVRETVGFVADDPAHECRQLRCELPEHPVEVRGDEVALGQLLLNLLLNACACVDCTRITVELQSVELQGHAGEAVLRVRDDGGGFSDDALDHVFEPFFSTRESSGLGLAVCRGIAHDHGGTIRAGNDTGAGDRTHAVVEVRLPLLSHRGTPA